MPFTAEDRDELSQIIKNELTADFARRRELRYQEQERAEAAKETNVFLITLTGHQLAIPDENGRAILTQCIYARVKVDPDSPSFFGGTIEVIAHGDGRLLKQPLKLTLTGGGVVGMIQVDEAILKPV